MSNPLTNHFRYQGNFSTQIYKERPPSPNLYQYLFTTQNPLQGWDGNSKGQPADPGTYVWELSYINGWTKKAIYEKGTSILIK